MKKLFKVTFQITDRGEVWPPAVLEFNEDYKTQLKKHLKKYRHSMDLSPGFKYKILSAVCVGYGFV